MPSKCFYKRKAEVDEICTEEKVTGRLRSDMATSEGVPAATTSQKR